MTAKITRKNGSVTVIRVAQHLSISVYGHAVHATGEACESDTALMVVPPNKSSGQVGQWLIGDVRSVELED